MDINNYLHSYYIHHNPVTKTASIFWYGKNQELTDALHGYPDVESARHDAQTAINEMRTVHPPMRDCFHRYTVYQVSSEPEKWAVNWWRKEGGLHQTIQNFASYEEAVKISEGCWRIHHSELPSLPMTQLDPMGIRRPVETGQPAWSNTSPSQSYNVPITKVKTFDEKWAEGIKAFTKDPS